MINHFKKFFLVTFCWYGIIIAAHAKSIQEASPPWLIEALKLQREIDLDVPLNEATFLGTHNSFNSKSYQITPLRYMDPNQTLSIYNQLEAGVRSIELDAHWTLNNKFTYEILLCHGQPTHFGCSLWDRPIAEGLKEIRNWLKENPDEIVLVYIERALNGHEPKLAALLNEYLGDFIFKPSTIRAPDDKKYSCIALPTTLSKADILRAGKQLLIVTKKCDVTKTEFNDYVFAGIGDIPSSPFTFIDAKISAFTHYPDCSKSNIFHPDPNHTSLWRILEDRTMVGGVIEPKRWLLDKDMHDLMRCGINWPSVDMLNSFDSRLVASIWSWEVNYPKKDHGNCAIYEYDKGIENVACDTTMPAYACKEELTHAIKVVPMLGAWADGELTCQSLAGKNWHFAVPINSQQMHSLDESMQAVATREVWLNYTVNKHGHWTANNKTLQSS